MGIEVQLHPEAREEYLAAIAWYLQLSERIARSFQHEIDEAIVRVADGPAKWPIFENDVRWIRLHRFPYVLYFEEAAAGTVQVLAVAHAGRRPGYWRSRR